MRVAGDAALNIDKEIHVTDEFKTIDIKGRTLRCIPKCPPSAFFALAEAERSGDGSASLLSYRDFLYTVVVDEDQETLRDLLADRVDPPTFEELNEAIGGAMLEYAGRPTQRPSRSSRGPEPTGGTSKVVSLSQGTVEVVETSSPAGT